MRAYSKDLRERVVAAVDRGIPRSEVVASFRVSLATVKRWLAQRRQVGDLTPKRSPGRPRTIGPEQHEALRAQLEADADATTEAQTERWNQAQGMTVSQWTVGRAMRRLGWTRKKRRWGRPSGTKPSDRRTGSGLLGGGPRTS